MSMNRSHIDSASSSGLIDRKLGQHPMFGPKQCPNCRHKLDQKPDWVGLPAGVKFDPTDQELIEHLEAKVNSEEKSHPLIDEFIPTIEGEDGICYTHPEKIPGVTRDGLSKHFFHRPSKAYTTGTRKRRKIQTECDLQRGETRWHKTGKTRPVMVSGRQKGCKKILVLYTNFGKNKKPEKTNWVMHQYHLGELEEEKDGELVVSKIFYQTQPRQCSWSDRSAAAAVVVDQGLDTRRESGSCSSKEVASHRDGQLISSGSGVPAGFSGMEMQHLETDNFSFAPSRQSFDEVGMGEDSSTNCGHEEQEHHHHHRPHTAHEQQQQQRQTAVTTAAYHMSRPADPISTIVSLAPLHQASIVREDPYHISRNIILQTDKFQKQYQQHHKVVERSGAGLEEIIMGCTSAGNKGFYQLEGNIVEEEGKKLGAGDRRIEEGSDIGALLTSPLAMSPPPPGSNFQFMAYI